MNITFIIGNLTGEPEKRTTSKGDTCCTFTVAVNKRTNGELTKADFFRVTAWRQLGDLCAQYLAKGRKVAVIGSVAASAYKSNSGELRASLEITADRVEFLSPKQAENSENGFVKVDGSDLPF